MLSTRSDSIPGPGNYDPEKVGKKDHFNTKTIFATSTKRDTSFIKKRDKVPGPGSYLEVKSIVNPEEPGMKYKFSAPFKSSKRPLTASASVGPAVGTYNPDVVSNIYYNNGKKAFRPSMINVPFSSLKKRFEEKQMEGIIGPGQYFREYKEKKTDMIVPFLSGDRRFRGFLQKDEVAPVGTYNLGSHFDWNRKTFNINFL